MDSLDRLYWRLVETLGRAPAPVREGALSVADLYQSLIPYRLVRNDLALYELPEYEHALLRLLGGERGYLRLESEEARADIARELDAPNPILGLYRDYAELHVDVTMPASLRAAGAAAEPQRASEPLPTAAAPKPPDAPARPTAPPPPRAAPPDAATDAAARPCGACRSVLPRGRAVRFCPFCGVAQPAACGRCGERVEAGWAFCAGCGQGRAAPRPPSA